MNHSSAGRRILLLHNELTSTPTLTSALEKAGFQLEGILRSSICKNGKIFDSRLYARIKE